MNGVIDFLIDHVIWVISLLLILLGLAVAGMIIRERDCTRHEKQSQLMLIWAGNGVFVPVVTGVDVCVEWGKEKQSELK